MILLRRVGVLLVALCVAVDAFVVVNPGGGATTTTTTTTTTWSRVVTRSSSSSRPLLLPPLQVLRDRSTKAEKEVDDKEEQDEEEDDFEFLFEEPVEPMDNMEKAWRHATKPLLRIGAKGAAFSHGNSLRQLLESHTIVKAKVNTLKFGSLDAAFEHLRDLAEQSGAPKGIELLQVREDDKMILFGLPGTRERIEKGEFPPQRIEKEEFPPQP